LFDSSADDDGVESKTGHVEHVCNLIAAKIEKLSKKLSFSCLLFMLLRDE
jgi:hypothetical protein